MGISKMSGKPGKILRDSLVLEWHPIQGGRSVPLVASCYGKWDKFPVGEVLG